MCGQTATATRYHFQLLLFCLVSLLLIGTQSVSASAIRSPTSLAFVKTKNIMAPKNKASMNDDTESSSVLRELKGTIQSQAAEIERLKKVLSAKKKPAPAAHGHHGGSAETEDILDYRIKSFGSIACERVGWLAVFLVSLSFTAVIMNGFEHTLSKQIELAYFVPLLAGHGGNTGGQAVGTVLSALSAGVITRKDALRVITKEAMSGMLMGCILGLFTGPICHYVMGISRHVSTVISVTLPLLSTIASFLGSSLPFLCVQWGLDPAVIAAPAMTSLVDITGLMCYFLIANKIFQLFGMEL